MNYNVEVKQSLFDIIGRIGDDPSPYVYNPDTDFTRQRALSLADTLKFTISMGSASIRQELFDFFDFSPQTPSSSALIQQRKKSNRMLFCVSFRNLTGCFRPGSLFTATIFWHVTGLSSPCPPACHMNTGKNTVTM